MAVDKRIELEIALRDSVSLALKAVAENLERINKAQAKSGEGKAEEGSDAFRKIKEHTEGIHKISTEGAKSVTAAAESMGNVAALLARGALRWALLGGEIIKFGLNAIQGSQKERLEWHALAEDTGLTEKFASMLVNAQRAAGIQAPQGKANVLNIANSIRDMAAGPGSEITKRLGMIGENDIARQIEDLEMKGEHEAAVRLAIKRGSELFERDDKTQAYKYADAWKMQPSFFKGMHAALQTAVPSYMTSLEGAKNWMIGWDIAAKYYAYSSSWLQNLVVKSLLPGIPEHWTPKEGAERQFNPEAFGIPADKVEAWKERNKETLSILKDILGIFQRQQNKQSIEKRWVGGSVMPGRDYLVGERGTETLTSGGSSRLVGTGGPEVLRVDHPSSIDPFTAPPGRNPLFGDDGRNAMWRRVRPERAVPGDPEETWNRLNRRLNEQPWLGYSEGGILPGEGNQPDSNITLHNVLKYREREMEKEQQIPKTEEGFLPRGGKPGEFYNPHTGEAQGQPINYRSMMDNEMGGGGAGSLGAEIIFKNVPEGVETEAEGDGFDNFTINKTRQLQGA